MVDEVLLVFAETIAHLIEARDRLKGRAFRSYDELISLAVRKVDEVAPVNVSEAAAKRARELGLKDLRRYCWFCQPRKRGMNDLGRETFHWEHFATVSEMTREIYSLGEEPPIASIATVLSQARIVWILKSENARLSEAKSGSRRANPAEAYERVGIALEHDWAECVRIPCKWHG